MDKGLLCFILSSEKRRDILFLLLDKPMSLKDLTNHFRVNASGLIPRIKELENKNFIVKNDGEYHLSHMGIILVKKLQTMDDLIRLFEDNGRFLNEHDLTPIPTNLLCRLDEIGKCKLIETNVENMNAIHREVYGNIAKSKSIAGISSAFDADYPKFFLSMAMQKIPVSIITTENIIKKIEKDHANTLQSYLKCDARMYIINDIKMMFVVTNVFIAIVLYKNGVLDTSTSLISFERSAINWGIELFEHYKQRSKEMTI